MIYRLINQVQSFEREYFSSKRRDTLIIKDEMNGNEKTEAVKYKEDKTWQASRSENGKFECKICGKFYSFKHSLLQHIESVHLKMTRYHCDLCPSKYYFKKNLEKHLFRHFKIEFCCNFCSKVLSERKCLNEHIDNVHKKICRFACHLCSFECYLKDSLRKHVLRHKKVLNKKKIARKIQMFKCLFCYEKFKIRKKHKKHS